MVGGEKKRGKVIFGCLPVMMLMFRMYVYFLGGVLIER